MKKYHQVIYNLIKRALFADRVNLILLLSIITLFGLNIAIWQINIKERLAELSWQLPLSPLNSLFLIFGLNLFLSLFSYDKEKEISWLLLGASLMAALLIFTLEIFYLLNL